MTDIKGKIERLQRVLTGKKCFWWQHRATAHSRCWYNDETVHEHEDFSFSLVPCVECTVRGVATGYRADD